MPKLIRALPVLALMAIALPAQNRAIDVKRSAITIHVGKAGLFSAAGHEHWVHAPIASGLINDSARPHVEFKIESAKLAVKRDPKVSDKDHAEIQRDMEEKVLEVAQYPEIAFRSSQIEKVAEGQWRVEGMLSLHGVTKPVSLVVTRTGEAYTGHTNIKQTDFGIKPISVGGGAIKVKNELEISFQIFSSAA